MTKRDRELGMGRAITRRDFLNGIALASGSLAAAPWLQGCGGDSRTAAGRAARRAAD